MRVITTAAHSSADGRAADPTDDRPGPPTSEADGARSAPDTAAAREADLIGGRPTLTMAQLAAEADVSLGTARRFWRGMGFPDIAEDAVHFTPRDVEALRDASTFVAEGHVAQSTMNSLLRAQGYLADRLALWQVEALVEDAARRYTLDDTAARVVVLDRLADLADRLDASLVYAWRRQLAALSRRIDSEIAHRTVEESGRDNLPLLRALGYIDMVSFTSSSASLGSQALAELVQGFEFAARDVITSHGARVVKTIGDAVLWVADDLPTAAMVAVELVRVIHSRPELLPVRGSLVWGRVISRSGDVFGPVVNLASRLVDVALPGTVVMDPATSDQVAAGPNAPLFSFAPQPTVDMPGIGQMTPIELQLHGLPTDRPTLTTGTSGVSSP
ncbi:adenylate/guanylate cyclase domain-containing protein [Georgenia sunbinii]|uniref:adenylate/guanylate cyclase domain-containing protein n=1 Tax=Georgenia sunbinii TaxID=3117728 RepID=UPI002F260F8B